MRATVSDIKHPVYSSNTLVGFTADLRSVMNYYSFGMEMPGRCKNAEYRFGFNGMEKDDEVKGSGNSYTTEWRQYDPRIGRWFSIDPMMKKFAYYSPYIAFNDNPINLIDPEGDESVDPTRNKNQKGGLNAYKTTRKQDVTLHEDGSSTIREIRTSTIGYWDGDVWHEETLKQTVSISINPKGEVTNQTVETIYTKRGRVMGYQPNGMPYTIKYLDGFEESRSIKKSVSSSWIETHYGDLHNQVTAATSLIKLNRSETMLAAFTGTNAKQDAWNSTSLWAGTAIFSALCPPAAPMITVGAGCIELLKLYESSRRSREIYLQFMYFSSDGRGSRIQPQRTKDEWNSYISKWKWN